MTDILLFVVFPYVALAIGIVGTIYRYLTNQYSFTSLSSQFLENDLQFWGSTLWHYGILPTTIIHIAGFAIPRVMAAAHGTPELLYVSELAGKILGIMALVGAGILLYRRLTSSKIRAITTPVDWVILSLLFAQVFFGLILAFVYRWGAAWFIYTATPWMDSLALFQPAPQFVTALPLAHKVHFLTGFLLFALMPFSRLVHIVTVPVSYLWRNFQLVIWTRRRVM
ncbi:MAG TPA: respiratory nitrate reductase subunit gamma [Anaerolineales bacterium]|jgi:nitrate reductase gamma subunit|nr:respiratory nitrate reductase subunit gamma [Anaerolineales bacterium]HQX15858.1 respiratory nitrate reductase subunit gamma [Anaerolineales bacterium]